MTGNDAAAAVLRASGLGGVSIHPVPGRLTDHYDPRSRTLNLSQDVGQAATVAALGLAGPRGRPRDPGRPALPADAHPPDARAGGAVRPVAVVPAGADRPRGGRNRARDDRLDPVLRGGSVPADHAPGRVRRLEAGAGRAGLAGAARTERGRRRARGAERGGAHLRRGVRGLARSAHLLLPAIAALT